MGGSNTLLALHPTSGQYEARVLDLGALYGPLPGGALTLTLSLTPNP